MKIRATVSKYAPYGIWAFFAFFCLRYAIEILNGGNSWKTGDWLINYSAGPIRRGLMGSILLTISNFGLSLLWLTYFFQVSIYATIFVFVLKLYKKTERGLFWLLILYSPAFLLFSFYDIQGGFRKEILVFAIFTFFCLIYTSNKITQVKLMFVSFIYVVAGLSHELTVFTLPFFLYLLYISAKEGLIKNSVAISYGIGLLVVSFIILLFSTLHKGDTYSADAICQSLVDQDLNSIICNGAINALGDDTINAISRVSNYLNYRSLSTPFLFALTMLPLFFTTWWKKRTYVLFVVSCIAMSPLFLFAVDWGRWIYILSFMLFCLTLTEKVTVKFAYKNILVIIGIVYLSTWSIPHCCVGGYNYGIIGIDWAYKIKNYPIKIIEILK